MIRIITLVGTHQGFRALPPFVFEIFAKKRFSGHEIDKKIEIFAFCNFVILGVKIGVFDTTESIPGVGFSL